MNRWRVIDRRRQERNPNNCYFQIRKGNFSVASPHSSFSASAALKFLRKGNDHLGEYKGEPLLILEKVTDA